MRCLRRGNHRDACAAAASAETIRREAAELDTVDAQLARLKGLYEKQLITREIYEAKQKEVLNQLMPAPPPPGPDSGKYKAEVQ